MRERIPPCRRGVADFEAATQRLLAPRKVLAKPPSREGNGRSSQVVAVVVLLVVVAIGVMAMYTAIERRKWEQVPIEIKQRRFAFGTAPWWVTEMPSVFDEPARFPAVENPEPWHFKPWTQDKPPEPEKPIP